MIEVVIDYSQVTAWGSAISAGHKTMKRLIKAGIPVSGSIWPESCDYGLLIIEHNDVFETITYSWSEEDSPDMLGASKATIVISGDEMAGRENPIQYGAVVLAKFDEAGIFPDGLLWPEKMPSGKLAMWSDAIADTRTYAWYE